MKAIAGLLDPAPVPTIDLAALSTFEEALATRAGGHCAQARLGPVAMVGCSTQTGPALALRPSAVLGACDARLDNRAEIRRLTDCDAQADDATLIAALYQRDGLDAFERLVGDYAVVLWDERHRRLVLARDPFGTRPLYYHRDEHGSCLWASSLEALLAARPWLIEKLDEEWIAGFLTSGLPADRSVYAGIRTVPPGHVIAFDAESGQVEKRRFWRPEELSMSHLGSDTEYEERYLELFSLAVACRMETEEPVFAELSGGLDSSSIVCVADRLLRRGLVPSQDLETISYVFDRAKTSDERQWMRPIEEHTGRPAHHLLEDEQPYLEGFEEAVWASPSIMTSLGPRLRAAAERMRPKGSQVILSGLAGDQVASGHYPIPPQFGDLAAEGRWLSLARELGRWRNHADNPHTHFLLHGVFANLLPRALRLRFQSRPDLMPWLHDGFAKRHQMHERYEGATEAFAARFRLPSQRARFDLIQHVTHGAVTAMNDDYGRFGVTMAYPFLDRRLVEFCLTTPTGQFCRPGEERSLVRRAMRGTMPNTVLDRPDKLGPDEALLRAFVRQWPRIESLFSGDAEVYRRGYVERDRLLDALARRCAGDASTNRTEMVIYLEVWLRHHRQQLEQRKVKLDRAA